MNDVVVGIGEILWDMLPEGKKLGGAPANFAYHISQFGINSYVISAVGNDSLGNEIIDNLEKKNIDFIIPRVNYPTGTVNVEIDANGIPKYEIIENVAWDNIPYSEKLVSIAKETKAICFGSLAQRSEVSFATINKFIDSVPKENDPLIVFDINLRQHFYNKGIIEESLQRCNILKINDEELEIIRNMFGYCESMSLEDISKDILVKYDLKMVILTCGTNGSYVFSHDSVSFKETPKVNVADTVGAGDSFSATFIANILKGMPIEKAHQKAVDVSAYVCTQDGAMPIIPSHYMD